MGSSLNSGNNPTTNYQQQLSPKLFHLTQTLRAAKQSQKNSGPGGGGQYEETVYRAVSPHGHVYWEIENNQSLMQQRAAPGQVGAGIYPEESEALLASYQNNPQTPLHDNRCPQMGQELRPLLHQPQHERPISTIGPSTSMDFPLRSAGVPSAFIRSVRTPMITQQQQQIAQLQPEYEESDPSTANEQTIPEQLQTQVQIRDCRPIQVSVKSTEYIEAKIRTLRKQQNR